MTHSAHFRSAMIFAALLALPQIASGQTAAATTQDCLEEVRSLYRTDLDSFRRPPHRTETTVYDPDGTVIRTLDTIWESPLAVVSGVRGDSLFTLLIGQDFWTGPTLDGPWQKSDYPLAEDLTTQANRMHAEQAANITDVTCPATVSLDGATYIAVGFRTQTNKDSNGSFFGALNTAYLDPETRLPQRWEQTEFINSWTSGVDMGRQVILFTYDPTIRLPLPE